MGHKVHPLGFRLGITKDWLSRWFDEKHYVQLVHEDVAIRKLIQRQYEEAGISKVEIERGAAEIVVNVHTSRPGIVIGRGGQRADELRGALEKRAGKKVRLNIVEVREPEMDATLVAKNIAEQLRKRVSYRRVMKQSISRTMLRGAKGIKVRLAGRLDGAEIARRETDREGSVPLHTLCADIDYGLAEALTATGKIGVKAWIYKGNIIPEPPAKPKGREGSETAVESGESS